MRKIKKIGLIHFTLLVGVLFLNSGCVFGLFGGDEKLSPKNVTKSAKKAMPTSEVATPSLGTIAPECSDDINTQSACNKGPIAPQELKPKITTTTGGEVHKLRSFQGDKITIIERKNGYLFPEYKNKIIILEMFGKNCSHCIKEMATMNRLRKRYKNKLEVIAIQVDDKMSLLEAKALIRRHHITYPIISGEMATNLQYNVQNTYGWTGILPFIMIIKNGVTEFSYRGEVSYNELNRDIQSILR